MRVHCRLCAATRDSSRCMARANRGRIRQKLLRPQSPGDGVANRIQQSVLVRRTAERSGDSLDDAS
jgi:hypothetical protein